MSAELLQTKIPQGISYAEYRQLGKSLLAQDKSSPSDQEAANPKMLAYTKLNLQRMDRWDKTFQLTAEEVAWLQSLNRPLDFVILSEVWCGDAAQNVPLLARIVDYLPQGQVQILFRDSHLDLMDQYLTNGGRSIPKLIVVERSSGQVLATWGPRPAPAQELVMAYKANPTKSFEEFAEDLHAWYAKDKGQSLKAEIFELLKNLA
jgi:hypothetical protein